MLTTPVLVLGEAMDCHTLADRMAELKIPGVSIAVIHGGVIEWAEGFGVQGTDEKSVTTDTLFQAGSISKPVAAMAALRFVQAGKLSLDADINQALRSWHIPPGAVAPDAKITLRELLTHTAGLSVHGFPGYAAGSAVPSLIQVLDGSKPANTAPIRLETVPGTAWNYSGGGYTVMQQALIDVSNEPFLILMKDTVLRPIGMAHSTYDQPLAATLMTSAASPYADGKPIPGGAHTYPEMAAAAYGPHPLTSPDTSSSRSTLNQTPNSS